MARLNNWDIIAIASYGASWFLISLGVYAELRPDPWAWLALVLGIWPAFYAGWRYMRDTL